MRILLLAATLLCPLLLCAQTIRSAPLRIMPIGDSITEGDNGGYRYPLFEKLTATIGMPNFVGRRNGRLSDPAAMPDNDHEGYSAYRIDEIASGVGFWSAPPIEVRLKDWDPAVVTVHAGTNDAQQNYHFDGDAAIGMPGVIERLNDLIERIRAYNPTIYVIVAQIIPANPPASDRTIRYIEKLNRQIPSLVAQHQARGHRVSMVDCYTPMLAYPNPDGIHPSAAGAQVMARVFFDGMKAVGAIPVNADPGRDDGLHQVDNHSTTSSTPWTLVPNLVRAGSATLASVRSTGYAGRHPITVLNDGELGSASNDKDALSTTTFTLDTSAHANGYDITEIRTMAGMPIAANGDERAHQAYEVWWSTVDAPQRFERLGDFHHIMVNREERASQMLISRLDAQPMMQRVKAIRFRFVEPPLRQFGFFGIQSPVRYREIEVLGVAGR
jgi:lysophospholipase L1-like esterase